MTRALLLSLAAAATLASGCSKETQVFGSLYSEAGSDVQTDDFGQSVAMNTGQMTSQQNYAIDLTRKFGADVPPVVNFAFNSSVLDAQAQQSLNGAPRKPADHDGAGSDLSPSQQHPRGDHAHSAGNGEQTERTLRGEAFLAPRIDMFQHFPDQPLDARSGVQIRHGHGLCGHAWIGTVGSLGADLCLPVGVGRDRNEVAVLADRRDHEAVFFAALAFLG